MARARLTSKGQITVPKAVRERLGVDKGDEIEFVVAGDRLEIRAVKRPRITDFFGAFRVPPVHAEWETQRRLAWEAEARRLISPSKEADDRSGG